MPPGRAPCPPDADGAPEAPQWLLRPHSYIRANSFHALPPDNRWTSQGSPGFNSASLAPHHKRTGRTFGGLYDRYVDREVEHPPTERIAAYVAALLERWCDLTEDVNETSPWSTGPLIRRGQRPVHLLPDAVEQGRRCLHLCGGPSGLRGACLLRPPTEPAQAVKLGRAAVSVSGVESGVIPRGAERTPAAARPAGSSWPAERRAGFGQGGELVGRLPAGLVHHDR